MPATPVAIASGTDDQLVTKAGPAYPPAYSFTRVTGGVALDVQRTLFSGFFYQYVGLLSFNTGAALADDVGIGRVMLRFQVTNVSDAEGRNLVGEWYSWDGASDNDWTITPSSTAFSIPISDLSTSLENEVELTNPDLNVSLTGVTKLRLFVDGGQPTGENRVNIATLEHATRAEPYLYITYDEEPQYRSRSALVEVVGSSIELAFPSDPVSAQPGDQLLAFLAVTGGSSASVDAPGWTAPSGSRVDLGTSLAGFAFRRVVEVSPPSTYFFGFDTQRAARGVIVAYRGLSPGRPLDVIAGQANSSASTAVEAPSISPGAASTRLVYAGLLSGSAAFTPPSGMRERVDQSG